jgi:flap endonuclease-1
MGVPYLNRFLKQNACKGMSRVSLSNYKGKKIVVDTSIYLYRFMSEGLFIENFYLMMTLFIKYEITPIFVFDGIPPQEKKAEIEFRYARKERAYEEYRKRLQEYEEAVGNRRKTLKKELDNLKRQFIRVDKDDIQLVKNLIQAYGLSYYTAKGEADVVCAELMKRGMVDACMSDDMDLFVYGCNKVLRYLSILNSTVIEYDLDVILNELNITFEGFRRVCVASGTDYNKSDHYNENHIDEIFSSYKVFANDSNEDSTAFYDWLSDKRVVPRQSNDLHNVEELFNPENYHEDIDNLVIYNSVVNSNVLRNILSKHGFIFI